jgi:hypothetical protein
MTGTSTTARAREDDSMTAQVANDSGLPLPGGFVSNDFVFCKRV